GASSWCPRCGFYPKTGTSVSADVLRPAWEEEKLEAGEIPGWVWTAGGGIALTLAGSLYARFFVPVDGPQTIVSLAVLGAGFLLYATAYLQAFLAAGSGSDKLTLMDFFLGPLAVWKAAATRLPDTRWVLCRGTWGVALMFCGLVVVGGLGWDELEQWTAAKAATQEKFNPLQQALGAAARGPKKHSGQGSESIDEAMNAFVNELGADGLQNMNAGVEEASVMKKQCAIVGYTKTVNGDLKSVLLASVTAGQPDEFVAKVPVDKIPASFAARLEALLPELRTSQPSVDCPMQAHWVRPDLSCMISFDEVEGEDGKQEIDWSEAEFLELLDQAGVSVDLEDVAPILEETQENLER
ncbi:MAG: hypothetical protein L0170_08440, partial [Acidobacteria bacterium]|nr:hypothetical protein [Acidobacteriota bacterium]